MTERMRHRTGNFAEYRGNAYLAFGDSTSNLVSLALAEEGDPIPEGLQPDPNAPTRVFFASPEQLDAWYFTRWTFRWHGELFDAEGSSGGRITGWFAGRDLASVADHLQQVEAGAYLGAFPLGEVTDLTEHRKDLLAEWNEEHQR